MSHQITSENLPDYKAGDRVFVVDPQVDDRMYAGRTGIVRYIDNSSPYIAYVKLDSSIDDVEISGFVSRFEKAPYKDNFDVSVVPTYKVGDRVKYVRDYPSVHNLGQEGIVTRIYNYGTMDAPAWFSEVKLDNGAHKDVYSARFDYVSSPVAIDVNRLRAIAKSATPSILLKAYLDEIDPQRVTATIEFASQADFDKFKTIAKIYKATIKE